MSAKGWRDWVYPNILKPRLPGKGIILFITFSISIGVLTACRPWDKSTGTPIGSTLASPRFNPPFPRLMGMNIGGKNYNDPRYLQKLSRLNLAILGFYKGWRSDTGPTASIQSVVETLKSLNPGMLLGQYTILSESYDNTSQHIPDRDIINKLNQENWWLRNAQGHKVQWTALYHTWEINFTAWSKPDAQGERFPQWLAQRNYNAFFRTTPGFAIWYSDNVDTQAPVSADWENTGQDQAKNDPTVAAAYRLGEASYWAAIRSLDPNVLIMGNTNSDLAAPQYKDKLNAAFREGLMGRSWSIANWGGWNKMMALYQSTFTNLLPPKIVGFNVWGSPTDYRFFRYAFTSCLMGNGYFSFTDKNAGYNSVPWFDEYNVHLGYPIDPPQTTPWQNGIYRRTFQNGLVLVNPTKVPETVSLPANTWKHFYGPQDPAVNNGAPVNQITLPSEDGAILIRQ